MNKPKHYLTWGELTAVVFFTAGMSLVFGFLCYLSLNFLSMGEALPSIFWAAVISLFLCTPIIVAICLKKTSRPTKSRIIFEWILLLLFVAVAFVAVFPFSHYFTVSGQKGEIQKKITVNITRAENMFAEYENYANSRLNIYENKLISIVVGKSANPTEYRSYGFVEGVDDNTQIESKVFILQAQLFPTNYTDTINHNGMKEIAATWLTAAKNTVIDWKPIGIVEVINKVGNNLYQWKEQLKEFSSFRAKGEITSDFDYVYSFDDITDRFTKPSNPNFISILCAIGIYMLIVLPYFAIKRHPKFPGIGTLFQNKRETSGGGIITHN